MNASNQANNQANNKAHNQANDKAKNRSSTKATAEKPAEQPPLEQKALTKAYLKSLLTPHRSSMMLALLLAVVGVLIFIAQSYLMAKLFADWLVDISHKTTPNTQLAWQILPWLAVCLVVRPVLGLIKNHILLKTSLTVRQSVRKSLLQAVVTLGPARQHFGSDGSLSTKMLEQVDELDGYISRFHTQKYVAIITPVLIVIATFFYSPLAAILMLLTAPLVPVFMILVGSAAAEKSREQFAAMSQLSGRFLDLLRGMPTLKRLHATTQAKNAIHQASSLYQKRTMSVLRLAFLSGGVLELFASLAIALVALYLGLGLLGILPWAKGSIPVHYEGALFILLLAPEFYAPLRQLGSDYHAKANADAAVAAFYPLLAATDSRNNTIDKPTATTHADTAAITTTTTTASTKELLQKPPALALAHISMTNQDGRVRLHPTSFQVNAAERIAITGESGSGKSSLLQAMLGFVPFSGEIMINDNNHSQQSLAHIRHHIGYLAQQADLLPISIAENLRLANTHASDDELAQVLEQVGLWDLVKQLPNGIHTQLGERGKGLSGGQQQRIAIAQLLLRNSTLWLIDEPCAHLDPETSAQIFTLLAQLSQNKTVLLVSHDLTQVDWVDKQIQLTTPKSI